MNHFELGDHLLQASVTACDDYRYTENRHIELDR
jgi:hypothetical protein